MHAVAVRRVAAESEQHMSFPKACRGLGAVLCPFLALTGLALDLARQNSGTTAAQSKYGVTGKGVVIAILDRGIDYQHPDFRNADGTTRIKWMLDMSGQNY